MTRWAMPTVKRLGTRAHAFVYRLSGGRILGRVGGQPVLLLQTVGRRSGQNRSTPVQYLSRDQAFVVVAANGGAARPPAWYLNLCAAPDASVRVGNQDVAVQAREIHDSERDDIWRQLTAANPYLDGVSRKAGRRFPVLVLAPDGYKRATAMAPTDAERDFPKRGGRASR
jgi:F420H(2)-dependent quinone reductase